MKNIKTTSRRRIHLPPIIAITLLVYLTAGCATIISGTQQELKIKPAGAKLEVYSWDGKLFASPKTESDSTVTVHRPHDSSYLIRVQSDGYCPKYWLTTPATNGVTFLNILTGGFVLIGLIIDGLSDAGSSYSPTEFYLNTPDTQQCGS